MECPIVGSQSPLVDIFQMKGLNMNPLSNLFGKGDRLAKGSHLDPEARKILEKIERLLQDDEAQLELMDPQLKEVLKRAPCYDKDPKGTGPFGLCKTNPIPVNGPVGELAYLSKLSTNGGERILFHRIGTVDNIDIFEAVTFSGSQWFIFFLDLYHPKKSRLAPDGFKLSPNVCQFSGFHRFCADFPYDFMLMKSREDLAYAYMPMNDIIERMRARAYERPPTHKVKVTATGVAVLLDQQGTAKPKLEASGLCFNCWAVKDNAILKCPQCGRLPTNELEAIYSVYFSGYHHDRQTLEELSSAVRMHGSSRSTLSPEQQDELRPLARAFLARLTPVNKQVPQTHPEEAVPFNPNLPDITKVQPSRAFQAEKYMALFVKDAKSIAENAGQLSMVRYPYTLAVVDTTTQKPVHFVTLETGFFGTRCLCAFDRKGHHRNMGSDPALDDEAAFVQRAITLTQEEFAIKFDELSAQR